jgi:hypothetical protein
MFQFPKGSLTAPLTTAVARPIESSLTGSSSGDPDANAYIALLEGDGVSVSDAQKTAIDTFYVTGKSDGWYTSLKRFYLPIWGAAAPNARCLVSSTSGTFTGSFTHGSGFTHPSASSSANRFNLNYKLSDEDLTNENACLMALAYDDTDPKDRGIPSSNQSIIGSGGVTSRSIRINTISTGLRPHAAWLGVNEDNGNMGSHGVLLANRKDGDTTLTRRNASGISDTSTTGTLTGTWNDHPIMGFGSSTGASGATTQTTVAKSGAFGISAGLSSTHRSSYTDAVKTLWETCSGLTL